MKNNRFAAIVLAGGLSTRMKEFKPLLPLGNGTITEHIVSTFVGTGIDVFLVVGHRREEIESKIKNEKVMIVDNPDYQKGMFSSVKAGVRGLGQNYQAFFVLPVDIPLVKPETIKKLMDAAIKNPGKIIYPVYSGKKGHPPLIPSVLVGEIMEWEKIGGLKAVLESHKDIAIEFPVNDEYILFDIDTPEDYQELLKIY